MRLSIYRVWRWSLKFPKSILNSLPTIQRKLGIRNFESTVPYRPSTQEKHHLGLSFYYIMRAPKSDQYQCSDSLKTLDSESSIKHVHYRSYYRKHRKKPICWPRRWRHRSWHAYHHLSPWSDWWEPKSKCLIHLVLCHDVLIHLSNSGDSSLLIQSKICGISKTSSRLDTPLSLRL